MKQQREAIPSRGPGDRDPLLFFALWIAWVGAAIAICAAAYVWFARGQLPLVTIFAALATIEVSVRIYQKQKRNPNVPQHEI